MKKLYPKSLLVIVVFLLAAVYLAFAIDLPKWFPFNTKSTLQEWQEKIFKDRVMYTVKPDEEDGYLHAVSNKACSGLVYRMSFDPGEYPMMSWEWKVTKFPEKDSTADEGSGGWIEKDDYAARVYVIFPSWIFTSTRSIEYVWDEALQEETVMTSPYFGNIKIIVVQSGRDFMDTWVSETRNIYEDYKKSFGSLPPMAGAIALMTDTDNTLSTAEAAYKNIRVGYKDE